MVQDDFTKLLQNYGDRLNDRKSFNGLVKDYFLDNPLQANLIMALYDMKIQDEIKTTSSIGNAFAFRFVKKLMDENGTSRKNADWAVSIWCVCYGKNILNKPCDIQAFDPSNATQRPSIVRETKVMTYKDLFSYKKASVGYSVIGFSGENISTIIFQDRYNGESVTEIAENAFSEVKVTQAILSEGYLKISKGAFKNCTELSQVVLPMSLNQIEDNAFGGCIKLSSITLPVNLGQIGKYAFAGTSIKTVVFPEALYWLDEGAFSCCDKLNNIKIPRNTVAIPEKCFAKCSDLTKIQISDGVEAIGSEAFYECSNLMQISLPDSVTKIGEAAFAGTSNKFVLQCSMGSFAEDYARKHKLKYQLI